MNRFFQWYQYIAPVLFLPFTFWLWQQTYANNDFVVIIMAIPILAAYVVPAVGTNILGLWEFNTRARIGKFRPHHGFVFGSATALIAFLCLAGSNVEGIWGVGQASFILASVLGFWNWLYDTVAIKAGFLNVFTRSYKTGSASEIAFDYAPLYFGMFGACYGAEIKIIEYYLIRCGRQDLFWILLIIGVLLAIALPSLVYIIISQLKYGDSGLNSYKGEKT